MLPLQHRGRCQDSRRVFLEELQPVFRDLRFSFSRAVREKLHLASIVEHRDSRGPMALVEPHNHGFVIPRNERPFAAISRLDQRCLNFFRREIAWHWKRADGSAEILRLGSVGGNAEREKDSDCETTEQAKQAFHRKTVSGLEPDFVRQRWLPDASG